MIITMGITWGNKITFKDALFYYKVITDLIFRNYIYGL